MRAVRIVIGDRRVTELIMPNDEADLRRAAEVRNAGKRVAVR